jgi:hypothetical protein
VFARAAVVVMLAATVPFLCAKDPPAIEPRQYLAELSRLGARKPFLADSADVYLEPQSLGRFFTDGIYRKLRGNAYFGYEYDEGFVMEGKAVQIEVLKDVTSGSSCQAAYRLALVHSIRAAGLELKASAPIQIGICIVGAETSETEHTLPGIMVEAYLRNANRKKSFFIRYGAGHPRGLPAAIRLSAEMLVAWIASTKPSTVSRQRKSRATARASALTILPIQVLKFARRSRFELA